MNRIILASQSPRRAQILEWAEIPFEVLVKHGDEDYPPEMKVEDIPEFLAVKKGQVVLESLTHKAENFPGYLHPIPVVAADTVVILDGEIIGKPKNRQEAVDSLIRLSGNIHKVVTGVAILYKGKTIRFSETTYVHFHPLTEQQIGYYVDKYQPYDKAGGYAIQEWIGVVGINKIEGDFYNVMGLPVSKLLQYLREILPEI